MKTYSDMLEHLDYGLGAILGKFENRFNQDCFEFLSDVAKSDLVPLKAQ